MKFTSKYATTCVSVKTNTGRLAQTDSAAFQFHETEAAAMEAVESGLRTGDEIVALLRVEALFKIDEIKLAKIT